MELEITSASGNKQGTGIRRFETVEELMIFVKGLGSPLILYPDGEAKIYDDYIE